ncbi:hypothetical protein GLOTRDRAFT_95647 [Gloeophyllum trabeum ATCC 11539]|uniref:Uncharacterized protein n=1 Tax=Gloeophyllum trabeum (strain ATCC 11539 / FP-39264 / Madison 617) TaxID=670483 RepID=S7PZB4_GLOTA|nr:uncharacterized protein GLOTRDRAFT_95647 [Gloeophyllum trabeum ATCC 11539]EPQ52823.1 hypothetical protein GLOTRDRAFT_95647 [Gloeophyllum trabeum ATCC 11539]
MLKLTILASLPLCLAQPFAVSPWSGSGCDGTTILASSGGAAGSGCVFGALNMTALESVQISLDNCTILLYASHTCEGSPAMTTVSIASDNTERSTFRRSVPG